MSAKTDNYHHGNLRESLIDAAIKILNTEGISGIKMRAVGQHLGVSQSAAYRHFSDKNALLAAVAKRGFDDLAAQLRLVREGHYPSLGEQMQHMGKAYIRYAIENQSQYRLMYGTGAVQQTDHPDLAQAARAMARQVYGLVAVCQEAGIVKGQTPREIVHTIWSMSHGAAMLIMDGFIQTDDIDTFSAQIVDYVSYGISITN